MENTYQFRKKQNIRSNLACIIGTCVIIAFVLIINFFYFRIVVVNGFSMFPTLGNGQIVLTKLNEPLTRGDIVVFDSKHISDTQGFWIKRVIGVEGDVVEINYEANTVTVNDKLLEEPYINCTEEDPMWDDEKTGTTVCTVPSGCLFVMGDNRNCSLDSRSTEVGPIPKEWVVGKVIRIIS